MTSGDLLTTSEAAHLIGCSRQHVVDLCDNDALPHTMVGTHRRIHRTDIERYLNPPLRREAEQSLWLHQAVAGKLVANPDRVLALARRNLAKHRRVHTDRASMWLDAWERILGNGVDAVLETITSRSPLSVELRQNTPFAGVLTERERLTVLSRFREHYRRQHELVA
jgi:excisionase family DNA binding protein